MSSAPILRSPSSPTILCVFRDLCAESSLRRPFHFQPSTAAAPPLPDCPLLATHYPLSGLRNPLTPLESALTDSCACKSFRIRSYEKTWGYTPSSSSPSRIKVNQPPANSFRITSFADPYPLTPLDIDRYRTGPRGHIFQATESYLGQAASHARVLFSPENKSPISGCSTSVLSSLQTFLNLQSYCPYPPTRLHSILRSRRYSLTGSERRTTQRFSMRLPLTVRWTTGAAVGETSTESRDVSSRGVYFFLSKDVREGSPVEILLTLPHEITLAGPVRVRCLGRVQPTESRDEGAIGVVPAIERYEFLRGDEGK